MSELSIKISIAGRVYPLTIERDEEEVIRKAAKMIDASVSVFQQNYAVKDKQDLLAMTALEMATKALQSENKSSSKDTSEEMNEVNELLNKYL